MNYEFTNNWFAPCEQVWPEVMKRLPESQGRRKFMEIGSFEGRSAVWLIENVMGPTDQLVCIDTWKGSQEHSNVDMSAVERRFDHNIALASKDGNTQKVKEASTFALARQLRFIQHENDKFDFIYIDGSHRAQDVLSDAVMAWRLVKHNGIMVLDDYLWGDPKHPLERPKMAIDAFMNIFCDEMYVLHMGHQAIVKKVSHG